MFKRNFVALAAFAAIAALLLGPVQPADAGLGSIDKQEVKCGGKLGKSGEKLSKTYLKEVGKCRDSDISGKEVGACPSAKNLAKIQKAADKIPADVAKNCASTCSASGITCIADSLCPPNAGGSGFGEKCSAGAKSIDFDMRDLGFPGPLCSGSFTNGDDWGTCIGDLTQQTSSDIIDSLYGSIVNASGISKDAGKCLSQLSKSTQKLISTIYKGVTKCRAANFKALSAADTPNIINPAECRQVDAKLAAKVQKAVDKLTDTANGKCTDAQILELDLCGNGVGGTATTGDAAACLVDMAIETADSQDNPGVRVYTASSLVEAAYPPLRGLCGDGVVNQIPSNFAKVGEECDGTDDAACPGNCAPPGDLYECTCLTEVDGITPKYRDTYQSDGLTADLDSGTTGTSHNSGVTDKAGYLLEIDPLSCDCDNMDGMECIGTTGDSVCDEEAATRPFCSWEPLSGVGCDVRGSDANFTDDDADCSICDEFSSNAGSSCTDDNDCSAQCIPEAGGAPTGACTSQGDCAAGEVCRGQCDLTQTCVILRNGAPLPISSGGTAVCVLSEFRQNVTGTIDIVTGEHERFVSLFSKTHLGVSNSIPCPVCGGVCVGGNQQGERCFGSCSTSGDDCRFDSDCPMGETCTSASAKCPGSECNLSLACVGGLNAGDPCRIEAATDKFGFTSSDCLPLPGQNISGNGLQIFFFPATSEAVSLPATLPCEAPGFENYDCPCPGETGRATRPNLCAFACDSGAEIGTGCATGGGNINGDPTTCAGGVSAGFACDEDADCPGSTCTANPTHCLGSAGNPTELLTCSATADCEVCVGGFNDGQACATGGDCGAACSENALVSCTTNGDCGPADGFCEASEGCGTDFAVSCGDACPSGRCVPLCEPGLGGEADEGFCSAGPGFFSCSSFDDSFRTCSVTQAEGSCNSTCVATCNNGVGSGGSGSSCSVQSDCPSGETCCGECIQAQLCEAGTDGVYGTDDDRPDAGLCVEGPRNCHTIDPVDGITGTGADALDDPMWGPNEFRQVSVYCIGATQNAAINSTAGLGGPGRLRQRGANVTNGFTSIP